MLKNVDSGHSLLYNNTYVLYLQYGNGICIMNRIVSMLLAAIMVFSLSSCVYMPNVFVSEGPNELEDEERDEGDDDEDEDKYIIYSDNSFAPFEYFDVEKGKYVGLDMDIIDAIAKDQGFKCEIHNEGFDASLGAVQSGQADAMIAGMTINEKRMETFDFSDGYFEDGTILVVKGESYISSLDDLRGKRIAAKKGTTSTAYAESIKDEYGFEIEYFDDSPAMYNAVMSGWSDACFEDYSVIGWAIKSSKLDLSIVGDVLNSGYYGFAVKKGKNAELVEMFNRGLENIKASGEYDRILAKYGYSK